MNQIRIERKEKDFLVVYKPAGIAVQSARIGEMDLPSLAAGKTGGRTGRRPDPLSFCDPSAGSAGRGGFWYLPRNKKTAGILSAPAAAAENDQRISGGGGEGPAPGDGAPDRYAAEGQPEPTVPGGGGGNSRSQAGRCWNTAVWGGSPPVRALLKIRLLTGRHHQIRVQLAHAGMPIAGDRKYNPKGQNTEGELGLCAAALSFLHPGYRRKVMVQDEAAGKKISFV